MSETDQPTGNAVTNEPAQTNDIPPCKFKVGDWVKMTAAARTQQQFYFMQKDDVGIVTNVAYVAKRPRRWWLHGGEEKYHLVTVYWQNSVHRKTGHEVKLKEKRLKFASRKRKHD